VYRHIVGANPDTDELVFGEGRDKISFYYLQVSPDGRWLLITASTGGGRNDLFLADLHEHGAIRP
jgi:prolyl oligopeptidase